MPVSRLNLVSMLIDKVHSSPHKIALRHKQLGIWQQWTWTDLALKVEQYLAVITQLLGPVQQPNTVHCVLLSAPSVDFFALCIALQHANITLQFIEFDPSHPSSMARLLKQIQADLIFIDDLKRLDGLTDSDHLVVLQPNNPNGLKPVIVYLEDHRVNPIQLDHCYPILDQINALDRSSLGSQNHELLQHYIANDQLDQLDPCNSLINPLNPLQKTQHESTVDFVYHKIKDGQHFHARSSVEVLINQAESLVSKHQLKSDEQALISPHSVRYDAVHTVWISGLIKGFCLNIPEHQDTLDQDRPLIAPTLMLEPISSYRHIRQTVLQKLPDRHNWIFKIAPALKYWHDPPLTKPSTESFNLLEKKFNALFQQAILATLGLSHLRHAIVIDEVKSHESTSFYPQLGINLVSWPAPLDWHRADWKSEPKSPLNLSMAEAHSGQGDSHVTA